jgi:pimeloyl-ACP methyl ester carboxylesterase
MRRSAVQQLPQLTAALTVPTLWIAGSRDTVMAPRYVRHLAVYAPNHQLRLLEGVGHLPMRQRPVQLAGVLREWLGQAGLLDEGLLAGGGDHQSAASPRSCSSASRA